MKFEEKTNNKFKKEEIFGCIIYFLIKDNEVVYVGQSKNGINRIAFHIYNRKDFDSFYFINCNIKELNDLENYYIIKYQPKYNKRLSRNSTNLISFSNFYYQEYKYDKAPRLSFKKAKEEIIKNKLYETLFNNSLYLNKNNLDKINDLLSSISLKLNGR